MRPPRGVAGCESCLLDTLGGPGGPFFCVAPGAPGTGLGAPQALSLGPLVMGGCWPSDETPWSL